MSRNFNLWLLCFLIQVIIVLVSGYFGFFNLLYLHDITYLGFLSLFLWFIASATVGMQAFKKEKAQDWQWFISDQFMYIGLLGTSIGIVVAFKSFFGINLQDLEAAKGMIQMVATGISSALLVTICSILTSTFLKMQMVIIDHQADKVEPSSDRILLTE